MTATHTPPDHGLTEGQIAAHYARLERQETAAAAPLPGPLADAFSSLQTEIAGIRLRPLVARDLALLRDLDSPLLAQFREFTKPAAERAVTPYTDEQAWEMVYLLAVPSRHARATLAQGRPAFRQAAERTRLTAGDVADVFYRNAARLLRGAGW